jgi:hypothetical protein
MKQRILDHLKQKVYDEFYAANMAAITIAVFSEKFATKKGKESYYKAKVLGCLKELEAEDKVKCVFHLPGGENDINMSKWLLK